VIMTWTRPDFDEWDDSHGLEEQKHSGLGRLLPLTRSSSRPPWLGVLYLHGQGRRFMDNSAKLRGRVPPLTDEFALRSSTGTAAWSKTAITFDMLHLLELGSMSDRDAAIHVLARPHQTPAILTENIQVSLISQRLCEHYQIYRASDIWLRVLSGAQDPDITGCYRWLVSNVLRHAMDRNLREVPLPGNGSTASRTADTIRMMKCMRFSDVFRRDCTSALLHAVPFPSIGWYGRYQQHATDAVCWAGPTDLCLRSSWTPAMLLAIDLTDSAEWQRHVDYVRVIALFQVAEAAPWMPQQVPGSDPPGLRSFALVQSYFKFESDRTRSLCSSQVLVQPPHECSASFKVVPIEWILAKVPLIPHQRFGTVPHDTPLDHLSVTITRPFGLEGGMSQSLALPVQADSSPMDHDGWKLWMVHQTFWRHGRSHHVKFAEVPVLPFQ